MRIQIFTIIALMALPFVSMSQDHQLNVSKKLNLKVVGGINTHFLLYDGGTRFISSGVTKRKISPRYQIGLEMEYQSKKRFVFAVEPILVQAKDEVDFFRDRIAYLESPNGLPETETLSSSQRGTRSLAHTYLSIPFFIKYGLGKNRNFLVKLGLSYHFFFRDKNNAISTEETYGIIRHDGVHLPILQPYTTSVVSSTNYTPCHDDSGFSFSNGCQKQTWGLSIGIEKRNFLLDKLNLTLRGDYVAAKHEDYYHRFNLSGKEDDWVYHHYGASKGFFALSLSAKYNIRTKNIIGKAEKTFSKNAIKVNGIFWLNKLKVYNNHTRFSLAYERLVAEKTSIGIRGAYFKKQFTYIDGASTLNKEMIYLGFFTKYYIFNHNKGMKGFYVGGAVDFIKNQKKDKSVVLPWKPEFGWLVSDITTNYNIVLAGMGEFGWKIFLSNSFFIEPSLSVGTAYTKSSNDVEDVDISLFYPEKLHFIYSPILAIGAQF